MNKRVYGFEQYKQLVKEGSYKPGFITEYEEGTSIDDLNNDAAPAEDASTGTEDAAAPAEDAAAPTEDASTGSEDAAAPTEDAAVPTEDASTGTEDAATAPTEDTTGTDGESTDSQKRLKLLSGVVSKYDKFVEDGGELDSGMQAKIDAMFKVLNDSE